MATGARITGGPELRARLSAIAQPFRPIGSAWQGKASSQMKASAPAQTGHLRGSIRPGFLSDTGAAIMGDYWAIFIDRGTKAHDIVAKGKMLKFEVAGETIFARKVHKRRTPRRPFVTQAAQMALKATATDEIVKLWNRKDESKRWRLMK